MPCWMKLKQTHACFTRGGGDIGEGEDKQCSELYIHACTVMLSYIRLYIYTEEMLQCHETRLQQLQKCLAALTIFCGYSRFLFPMIRDEL